MIAKANDRIMNQRHSIPWLLNSLLALDCVAGLTTAFSFPWPRPSFGGRHPPVVSTGCCGFLPCKAISPSPSALDVHGLNRSFAEKLPPNESARLGVSAPSLPVGPLRPPGSAHRPARSCFDEM